MQGTALAWEIYERTHDPLALGYVGLARALPVLVLALPAGQLVDLLDRRKVLIGTQIAFAAASVALTLGSFYQVSIWWMYILVALTGCARVFNGPTRASLLPHIVLPRNFHNAVTWNSGVFQFSATSGPLIAGTLLWWWGVAWPVYAIAGASCIVFGYFCSFIRPYPRQERHTSLAVGIDALRPGILLRGMLAGAAHVWREKTVFGAIALDLFAVLLGGATALMPVFAKDILNVGPVGLGALKSAPYVGALIMAFVIAHRPPMRRAGPALLWSVAGFGLCTILFGISKSFILSLSALVLLGALDNISVVVRHVLVAVRTPDALRGRVSAVNSVFIESSNELGGFESGLVARIFTPVISVVSGGIGTILVVLVMTWCLPELRRLRRLEEPTDAGAFCRNCRYDLAGNTSGICPECGTPTTLSAQAEQDAEEVSSLSTDA